MTWRASTVLTKTSASTTHSVSKRTVIAGGTELRILPLGASITVGFRSTDGNGYRLDLLDRLAGSNVQYVGTVRAGTMDDVGAGYHAGIPLRLM